MVASGRDTVPRACQSSSTTDDKKMLSAYAMRCVLAMAIIRLVNGVTTAASSRLKQRLPTLHSPLESHGHLQKSYSVSGIANSVGLPSLCVEVRHAATHNALPPMSELVLAAKQVSLVVWMRSTSPASL